MLVLILGLVLFLGIHSVKIVAPGWTASQIAKLGADKWKGIYSLLSIAGFVLLIWGYGMAREEAGQVYEPVLSARGLSFVVMPVALILVFASQFPAGYIKRVLKHPMLWGVLLWSIIHLMNNGDMASVLLFGAFLVWSVLDLISCYRRPASPAGEIKVWPDAIAIGLGVLATVLFVTKLHEWFFGVAIV